ncbi:MAG: DTW domain-containing protein [Colwellia sp.]|nr:DTW domain-containing protein [Colwellia sp.]MCW8864359.1 DTW domain-containing protein [Colwellia sp.]MCW9081078.1 DTW domain-containing protein [Colwellia sp.]
MHAVHQLHHFRKSLSTTTYKARGQRVIRCSLCQLSKQYCICSIAPKANELKSNAGFLLLMYDTEVLKPSNTGKLIADLIPDTYAFLWSRTTKNDELQAVLDDEQWQPFVVFPQEYAQLGRRVESKAVKCELGKRPLFIMLDGSWREAKKMFRKSPYLDKFPMVSFDPKVFTESCLTQSNMVDAAYSPVGENSRYTVRKTELAHQFSTAEVGARVLAMFGEHDNAHLLDLWFDVFNFQYQKSVCQRNKGNPEAIENYQRFKKEKI